MVLIVVIFGKDITNALILQWITQKGKKQYEPRGKSDQHTAPQFLFLIKSFPTLQPSNYSLCLQLCKRSKITPNSPKMKISLAEMLLEKSQSMNQGWFDGLG